LVQRYTSIRIPKIRIGTASAGEVFHFVGKKLLENDPDPDPANRGISFITALTIPQPERTVNYERENIEVGVLLQDLANLFDVHIHITSVGIFMTSTAEPPFPNSKAEKGVTFKSYAPSKPK
jgi:hypothetical protein